MEILASHSLAALSHPIRLGVVRLLMRRFPDRVPAGEIGDALGVKPSTLSAYLAALTQAGLVTQTRAGTSRLYSVDMVHMRQVMDFLWGDCFRGRPDACSVPGEARPGAGGPLNVLFLCTANSARSIFAEAILRDLGAGRFEAHSAGLHPQDRPHPDALAELAARGHDVSGLWSKSVNYFRGPGAPRMDFVFTVCDRSANEDCPSWPGAPITGHFGTPDPVRSDLSLEARKRAFRDAYDALHAHIAAFVEHTRPGLTRMELQQAVDNAARLEGTYA